MDSQSKAEEKMTEYQLHFRYTYTGSDGDTWYANRTVHIVADRAAEAIRILKALEPTAFNIYENIWARKSVE